MKNVYIFPAIFSKEENEYIAIIQADMLAFKRKYNNQTIKKTLTLPKWLNDIAIDKKINFSKVLQDALKEKLDIY